MPKKAKMAAEKPRRRVTVGRKPAQPEVPFDVQVAIETAVAALDVDGLREAVLKQEIQLCAIRTILFDFAAIMVNEEHNRNKVVSKERFADFVRKLRKALSANLKDLASFHDAEEVQDLEELAEDFDVDIGSLIRSIADEEGRRPSGPIVEDEMEDIIERAVVDAEESEHRRLPGRGRNAGRRR